MYMSLEYEVSENENYKEGNEEYVSHYVTEKLQFPCYIIRNTEESPVEKYKIDILKQMFSTSSTLNEEDDEVAINLYFSQGNQLARIGKIYSHQVKSFLNLFKSNCIDGYFNKDKPLKGNYLYVLSN